MGLGTGLTLAMVLLARLPSWRAELGTYQALFGAAFVFYAVAVWRSTRDAPPIAPAVVMAVAVAARVALLLAAPTLSNAIQHDLWEARVVDAGRDPYRTSSRALAPAPLRDANVDRHVDQAEIACITPPLELAGFALVARLSPTVWAMKVWIVLHDLVLVWLLIYWVRGRGLDATAAIAYAWSPLVLTEYAGSGHHDPISMVWLVAALMFVERRPLFSAAALSIATLSQLAPIVAVPFVWTRWSVRARWVAGLLIGLGLAFYAVETRGAWAGWAASTSTAPNNDLLFHYLESWLNDAGRACLLAGALVLVLIVSLAWRKVWHPLATRATLRGALLASPVAHPWWFGWAMLLEPLGRSPGWILLSLTCVLSYGLFAPPAQGADFRLALGWRWVEYGVPLLVAAIAASVRRRNARQLRTRR